MLTYIHRRKTGSRSAACGQKNAEDAGIVPRWPARPAAKEHGDALPRAGATGTRATAADAQSESDGRDRRMADGPALAGYAGNEGATGGLLR